jgi:hypothetical protein
MAGFRKAKAEQAALKIGVYGPAGSGKTFTALLLAEGLAAAAKKRVAFVDTEHGTDFYTRAVPERRPHPAAFDFDALYTRSISETIAALRGISESNYAAVVIDSITHLWEAAIQSYSGKHTSAGTIPFHAWGKIKKPYKDLMTGLLNSGLHVLICGRQKNEWGEDEESGETKVMGVTMKAEGETPYEPHVLIRMQRERTKSGQAPVSAYVEKDRSGLLAGQTIVLPPDQPDGYTYDQIARPLLSVLTGKTQAQIQTADEAASEDADALAVEDAAREDASTRLRDQFIGRLMAATTKVEVAKISGEVSKDIKKQMLAADVAAVREAWQAAAKKVTA